MDKWLEENFIMEMAMLLTPRTAITTRKAKRGGLLICLIPGGVSAYETDYMVDFILLFVFSLGPKLVERIF